jgi:hypothetical protein
MKTLIEEINVGDAVALFEAEKNRLSTISSIMKNSVPRMALDMRVVQLRDIAPGEYFHRLRKGVPSKHVYEKLGYNPRNKRLGYSASFTCGREDDIGYSIELNPNTPVILSIEICTDEVE